MSQTVFLAEMLPAGQTAAPEPIYRAPVVYGPFHVGQPSTFTPEIATTLHGRAAPLALVADLPYAFGRSFHDVLNDAGAAELSLDNEDGAVASVEVERVVRYWVRGVPAFDAMVEQLVISTIAQGEEHDQLTAFQGRGKVCVFEEAVVYPSYPPGSTPVEDDRTFDWTLPQYDDSWWTPAHVVCTVAFAQLNWPFLPFATGWTDTSVSVVWSPDGTYLDAADGYTNYFRDSFTVAAAGAHVVQFVVDDNGALYIDGVRPATIAVTSLDAFSSTHVAVVELSAGAHTVAIVGTNGDEPLNPNNPGGVAAAIYVSADANQTPGALVWSTGAATKMVVNPPGPPGMTIGRIIRLVLEEAQARSGGALGGVDLAFTDVVDSNGSPWETTSLVSTKVGNDLLTFLKELSGTYVDFWMPPGTFTLYACAKGQRGGTRAVSLGAPTSPTDPTSGSVTTLTHKRTI